MIGWAYLLDALMAFLIGTAAGFVVNLFALAYFLFTISRQEVHRRRMDILEKQLEVERERHGRRSSHADDSCGLDCPDGGSGTR